MMLKTWGHIRKGAGRLPCCGDHPGTPFLLVVVALGAAAGAQSGGWTGAMVGSFAMLIVFGPIWCLGAISRAKIQDKENQEGDG